MTTLPKEPVPPGYHRSQWIVITRQEWDLLLTRACRHLRKKPAAWRRQVDAAMCRANNYEVNTARFIVLPEDPALGNLSLALRNSSDYSVHEEFLARATALLADPVAALNLAHAAAELYVAHHEGLFRQNADRIWADYYREVMRQCANRQGHSPPHAGDTEP